MDKSRQNFEYIKSSKKTRYTHYLSEAAHNFIRNNKYIIELLAEGSYTAKPDDETQAPVKAAQPVQKPSFNQSSYYKPSRDDELIPAGEPVTVEDVDYTIATAALNRSKAQQGGFDE